MYSFFFAISAVNNKIIDGTKKRYMNSENHDINDKKLQPSDIIEKFENGETIEKDELLPFVKENNGIVKSWIRDHDALMVEYNRKFIVFQEDDKDVIKKFEQLLSEEERTNCNNLTNALIDVHGTFVYFKHIERLYNKRANKNKNGILTFLPTNMPHGWIASYGKDIQTRVNKQSKIINQIMEYISEKALKENHKVNVKIKGCSYGNLPAALYCKQLVENVDNINIENLVLTYPARQFGWHANIKDIVETVKSINPEAGKKISQATIIGNENQSTVSRLAHPVENADRLAIMLGKLENFAVNVKIHQDNEKYKKTVYDKDKNTHNYSERPELNIPLLVAITILTAGIGAYYYYNRYKQQVKRHYICNDVNSSLTDIVQPQKHVFL